MASAATKEVAIDKETISPELPVHEQIASLAYALWQARGCPEGSSDVDWLQAEEGLTSSR